MTTLGVREVAERVRREHRLVFENDGGDYGGRSWFECSCDADNVLNPTEYATEDEHAAHVVDALAAALVPVLDGAKAEAAAGALQTAAVDAVAAYGGLWNTHSPKSRQRVSDWLVARAAAYRALAAGSTGEERP